MFFISIKKGIDIMRTVGIDLAQDAQKLAGRKLEASYDTLRKMVSAREGFTRVTKNDENVKSRSGMWLDGYLRRYVNLQTGAKENVFYGRDIQRVVYDQNDVPVGAIQFHRTQDGHFDAFVLAPGENAEIMQVKPDGSKTIFQAPSNFFEHFDIRNLMPLK